MQDMIDYDRILIAHAGRDVAQYLRELLETHPEPDISASLLRAVEHESLPPTVLATWLTLSRSSAALRFALEQEYSVTLRTVAIKRLGKAMSADEWRETWTAIGAVPGVLRFLAEFSVSNVILFMKHLGCSARGEDPDKRKVISELLCSLAPELNISTPHKTTDLRPLTKYYAHLLPGCTSELVRQIIRSGPEKLRERIGDRRAVLCHHHKLFQELCIEQIRGREIRISDTVKILNRLLENIPPARSNDLESEFSEPMSFSYRILKLFTEDSTLIFPGGDFISKVARPLIRNAARKHIGWQHVHDIVSLTVRYLQALPDIAASALSFSQSSVWYDVLLLWSKKPELFQNEFVCLLQLVSKDKCRRPDCFANFYGCIRPELRNRFWRLLFMYSGELRGDIDDDVFLKNICAKDPACRLWPMGVFFGLAKGSRLPLLARLRRIFPEDDFLNQYSGNYMLSKGATPKYTSGNPVLLDIWLRREEGDSNWGKDILNLLEEQKKNAAISKEQTDRAFYARSAMGLSLYSGSLDVFSATLDWSRRFLREPLTIRAMFADSCELAHFLSGVGAPYPTDYDITAVKNKIKRSHELVWTIFEMARSALREPSFNFQNWVVLITLVERVTRFSIETAKEFQTHFKLSDSDAYNTVFESLLELSLRIEKARLNPANAKMRYDTYPCPLGTGHTSKVKIETQAAFEFVDNLARQRDELWAGYRSIQNPNVTTIPEPLPRGLPLQCLLAGADFSPVWSLVESSFIGSRMQGVIFPNAAQVLKEVVEDDDDFKNAVGSYVDSYPIALKVYTTHGLRNEEQEARVSKAFNYALEHLSGQRMSKEESVRFWSRAYMKILGYHRFHPPSFDPPYDSYREFAPVPEEGDSKERLEWNPAGNYQPRLPIKARPLKPIILDCMLGKEEDLRWARFGYSLSIPQPETISVYPPTEDVWAIHMADPALKETQIASALLYLDSQNGNASALLKTPFPLQGEARYPAMFLEEQFLLGHRYGRMRALEVLERLIADVPPTLVWELTQNTFKHLSGIPLDDPKLSSVESMAYDLLQLLSHGDRPHLAIKPILRIIMEKPDASSWHRHLLSEKFLRKLSAAQARKVMETFSEEIAFMLQQQSRNSKKEGADSPATSVVKVTTVKYLAQLMKEAICISPQFPIGVLKTLFESSSHPDVRLEVVRGWLEILEDACIRQSPPDIDAIVSALHATIPVLSAFNESRPIVIQTWDEIVKTKELPEVYFDDSSSSGTVLPPLFSTILQERDSKHNRLFSEARCKVMNEIILPAIKESIENNKWWMSIFLQKHGVDPESLKLPAIPMKPALLTALIKSHPHHLPAWILDLYVEYHTFLSDLPGQITHLREKIINDPTAKKLNESKHWLSTFYESKIGAADFGGCLRILAYEFVRPSELENGISLEQIQKHIIQSMERVFNGIDSSTEEYESFVSQFRLPVVYGYKSAQPHKTYKDWQATLKPVIDELIVRVSAIRTPEWQRNPERKPSTLPSTLQWRLWSLPFPFASDSSEDNDCEMFAEAVKGFITEVVETHAPYHDDFKVIEKAALQCHPDFKAQVGICLGKLTKDMTLVDHLCLDLAGAFFRTASLPKKRAAEHVKAVLKSWEESEIEWVRMKGFSMKKLEYHDKEFKRLLN